MRRNSDKLIRLSRRRASLFHAVKHDLPQEQIARRIVKVRLAVLTALKKERVRSTKYAETECTSESTNWTAAFEVLENKWLNMAAEDIIEISSQWPEQPRLKDLGLKL